MRHLAYWVRPNFVVALALYMCGASAEPLQDIQPASAWGNLNLQIYGFSYHPDRKGVRRARLDNELNVGLGLNYTFHEDVRGVGFVEAGAFRDSGSNWAKVAGVGYQFKLGERWRLGGALARLYSPTYNRGRFFITPLPIVTYDFGPVKLNASYAPRYKDVNQFGASASTSAYHWCSSAPARVACSSVVGVR